MLTQTLRDLEMFGIVHREVYPVIPPKVEYSLTEYAQEMLPIQKSIKAFGKTMYARYEKEGLIEKR
jgi:DNA-binding HxlR family transcriptional regulator